MYRCSLCTQPSRPGQPRLLHVVKRPDGSILRELPVCSDCQHALVSGRSLDQLRPREVKLSLQAPTPAPLLGQPI